MMMWGARSVGVCTALMWRGFEVFERILRGLDRFLEEQGYASYEQIVGLSLQHLVPTAEIDLGEGAAVIDPNLCRMCGLGLKPAHCDAIVEEGGGLRVVRGGPSRARTPALHGPRSIARCRARG
jgi:hypothetical protein